MKCNVVACGVIEADVNSIISTAIFISDTNLDIEESTADFTIDERIPLIKSLMLAPEGTPIFGADVLLGCIYIQDITIATMDEFTTQATARFAKHGGKSKQLVQCTAELTTDFIKGLLQSFDNLDVPKLVIDINALTDNEIASLTAVSMVDDNMDIDEFMNNKSRTIH